jgi:phage RecT family recombinase
MTTKTAPPPAPAPAKPTSRYELARQQLEGRKALIESVLPEKVRPDVDRMMKRAALYFLKAGGDLTIENFLRCVIEAAEMGLAIDGKLCYAIAYKGVWQAVPDYKGLLVVARRSNLIRDAHADVVREGDEFEFGWDGSHPVCRHRALIQEHNRGDVTHAYATVLLRAGGWNYTVMTRKELDEIQSKAPSKAGPWATHPNEMRKKTVLKRLLKMYRDDPGLASALDLDDRPYEVDAEPAPSDPPIGRQSLRAPQPVPAPAEMPREAGGDAEDF